MADPPVNNEAHHHVKPDPGPSNHIEQLALSSSVLDLEAGVKVGVHLLEDLKAPLSAAHGSGNPQAAQWLSSIRQVEEKAKQARNVVGVVGMTGAGKSSVINAVLDEERLVPTSGMRACTASVTEISYNHSDDPSELYRAEVEFLSAEEWSRELNGLLDDLIDSDGKVSSECNNPDTEAGLAYSKIKAAYPHMTKKKIARRSGDSLAMAQEPLVRTVLGSVKRLRATSSPDLYEDLQQYIDSRNKTSSRMEYWPLVKVVRIYCKAPALSTGVVLVDLPGVQDSNAARAAVAEDYIKLCNALWITAGIQRAPNDKAAQKILDDSLKRQLQYDGALSAVTFVCTKADDILIIEADKSIADEIGDYTKQIEYLGQEGDKLNVRIDDLKNQANGVQKQLGDLSKSSDRWEELKDKLYNGETVYRPSEISKKRKRKTTQDGRRKARGPVNDISDSDTDSSDDSSDGEEAQAPQGQKTPLTKGDIKDHLESLKAKKKESRKSKKNLEKEITKAERELAQINADAALAKSEQISLCIRSRNKCQKENIKRGFAMDVKELDQDLAIEQNEADFDPEKAIRDYDEIAQRLHVFCVSARAYQKLAGRLGQDVVQIDGFTTLEDTEIPQLQEHAKRLTEDGRIATARLFLNELSQLLNSMRLWAAGSTRMAVIKTDQKYDEKVLNFCLAKVEDPFRQAMTNCLSSMKHDLQEQLYETFDRFIPVASGSALETAIGWGKLRADGGMNWASYKATCRRGGSWTGLHGSRNFNVELFEPINKQLVASWERTFRQRIPPAVEKFSRVCHAILGWFHENVVTHVPAAAANPTGTIMLGQQIRTHQTTLLATPNFISAKITEGQREANRGFTPVIQDAMQPAYDACARERGPGTFHRMKSTMEAHVDTARNTMFRQACDDVKEQLNAMCASVEQYMMAFVQDLVAKLQRDYRATLLGGRAGVTAAVPLAERMLHSQLWPILEDADSRFAQFVFPAGGEVLVAAVASEQEDADLIAQQLEDVPELDTMPGVKQEPF